MRVFYALLALAAFGIGVAVLVAKVDRMRTNARIEAQNDRISASNRIVESIRSLDSYSRECTDWMTGLTTGTFQQQQLKPRTALQFAQSCDSQMLTSADKALAAIQKAESSSAEAQNAQPFFTAARELTAAYRSQSEDFGQATELLTTAYEDGSDLSRHRGAVSGLVNRALPAVNEGLAALEDTRRAFIYPDG